uniref:Uncharacterized protein n=1 Tax=Hyaloperonospora arabidopsidis (strain Emoy2) TaxID=559515 RepID=M4C0X5_HYAAE
MSYRSSVCDSSRRSKRPSSPRMSCNNSPRSPRSFRSPSDAEGLRIYTSPLTLLFSLLSSTTLSFKKEGQTQETT